LLGLGKTARREDIIDAHRRLVARVHPDKGGTGEQVLEANAARDLLLARLTNSDRGKSGQGR
jgi:curved DNA-binding protein CbpA